MEQALLGLALLLAE